MLLGVREVCLPLVGTKTNEMIAKHVITYERVCFTTIIIIIIIVIIIIIATRHYDTNSYDRSV